MCVCVCVCVYVCACVWVCLCTCDVPSFWFGHIALQAPPAKPRLNILTWMDDVDGQPGRPSGVSVPKELFDTWNMHPVYGEEFRTVVAEIQQTCGVEDMYAWVVGWTGGVG